MYIRHDETHEESRFAPASSRRSSHSLHFGHCTKCLLSFLAASSRRFSSLELSRAFMPKELGSDGLVPGCNGRVLEGGRHFAATACQRRVRTAVRFFPNHNPFGFVPCCCSSARQGCCHARRCSRCSIHNSQRLASAANANSTTATLAVKYFQRLFMPHVRLRNNSLFFSVFASYVAAFGHVPTESGDAGNLNPLRFT
jgi:hypothetical protein